MQKVILITGASSGIGKEIARVFFRKKYQLLLSGRDEAGFTEFKNSPSVDIVVGDFTIPVIREKIASIVTDKYKRLDVLVNNAGITYIQPFEANTDEQLDRIIETNLKAPILLTQKLYPVMKSQKSGTIVFINSGAGKQGYLNHTLYSTTKFGLTGFAQSLRLEAKKDGIRVISVHPGGVKTHLYDNVKLKPDTGEYMEPEKLAELVVFLTETESLSPDEISVSRLSK